MQSWAKQLKSLRKRLNDCSTKFIAYKLGVSHRTVEGWEQGRKVTKQTKLFIKTIFPDI